jgi:hypothetical protein
MGETMIAIKNIIYATSLGNFGSVLRQIADLSKSFAINGIVNTTKALGNKIKLGDSMYTVEELGLENLIEATELSKSTGRVKVTSKALETILKWEGFNKMDRAFKQVYIDSAYMKAKQLANRKEKLFMQEMDYMFGNEANQVIDDILNDRSTDDVKYYLASKLLDVQPIAKTEVPQSYLRAKNGKIFYMLRNFGLKELSMYRNIYIRQIKNQDRKTKINGYRNLFMMAMWYQILNVGVDALIRGAKGDDQDPLNDAWNNLMKAILFNKYSFTLAERTSFMLGAVSLVMPAGNLFNDIYKDGSDLLKGKMKEDSYEFKNLNIIRDLTPIGWAFYQWFGLGHTRIEKKKQKAYEDKEKQSIITPEIAKFKEWQKEKEKAEPYSQKRADLDKKIKEFQKTQEYKEYALEKWFVHSKLERDKRVRDIEKHKGKEASIKEYNKLNAKLYEDYEEKKTKLQREHRERRQREREQTLQEMLNETIDTEE